MGDFSLNIIITGALMTMLLVAEKLKGYKRSLNDYIMIAMMIFLATCLTRIYADETVGSPYSYQALKRSGIASRSPASNECVALRE